MSRLLWPLGLAAAMHSPVPAWAQTPAPLSTSTSTSTTTPADAAPAAPATSPLTLEQALSQALARSPALAAASRQVEAARAAAQQAGAWRNPELSVTVEDARSEARTTTVMVGVPLELGGKRQARLTAAARAVGLAEAELRRARAELRAGVAQAFFAALVAQERLTLADGAVAIAARAAEAAGRRVAAGKVSPVEATRARVDLAQARLERAEAQGELRMAHHALAALLGDVAPAFGRVQGEARAWPERPGFEALSAQIDEAPALMAAQAEVDRRAALVAVERSKASPDVMLSLGSKRDASTGRSQAVLGLALPLPLFDRNQGSVVEASRLADQARDVQQLARLTLLAELQEASIRLTGAQAALQALQDTVLPAAQEAHDAASRGFEAGKFGFLEVLDAQRTLLQARARYLNTLAAAHQAAATLDRITGR